MKLNLVILAALGLLVYILLGEAALWLLLRLRHGVLGMPMIAPHAVHIILAVIATLLWSLGWIHDTISGGNVGIPWIAGFPLDMPLPTGAYWKAPGLMKVNEISMVRQTTPLNGKEDKGMQVSAVGIGNVAGDTNASTFVGMLVKTTLIWRVVDPIRFFNFLELNWGDDTDWAKAKLKAENTFVPKVLEFIRSRTAQTSYSGLIVNHLQGELDGIRTELNGPDVDVITGIGVEVREIAISKVEAEDPKFKELLAGSATEAEEKKKETKDLETFGKHLEEAMKGLIAQGWDKNHPDTREEALRIVREVQRKQNPATRLDISGLGGFATALAKVLAGRSGSGTI